MKKFLLVVGLIFGICGSLSAAERNVLVNGDGAEIGTASNPIKISLTAGGGGGEWTDQGTYLEPNEPLADSVSIGQDLSVDTSVLYVNSNLDRVGVRTATPARDLEVTSDTNAFARVTAGTGVAPAYDATLELYGNNDWSLINDGSGDIAEDAFILYNNTSSTSYITALSPSNHIGIFKTNPAYALDVTGDVNVSSQLTASQVNVTTIAGTAGTSTATVTGSLDISSDVTIDGYILAGVDTLSLTGNTTLKDQEVRGTVVYIGGGQTATLPAIGDGDAVTFLQTTAGTAIIDSNASDKIWLDGTALDDGDSIDSANGAGSIATLTYYSADGWFASTDSWTDGGAS